MARNILFALGAALLLLNVYGLTRSLRSPQLAGAAPAGDLGLSHAELLEEVRRRPAEPSSRYIARATSALSRGMASVWSDDVDALHIRVPAWENYLLFAGSYLRPDIYRKYEFADPGRAMERGLGLCSQHAVVLTGLLEREGIPASLQALSGHVVVRAYDENGAEVIADPDNGVVIPHAMEAIERNLDLVRARYSGRGHSEADVQAMVRAYGSEGNYVLNVPQYFYQKIYYLEYAAYFLKWALPLLLMSPFAVDAGRSMSLRRLPGAAVARL